MFEGLVNNICQETHTNPHMSDMQLFMYQTGAVFNGIGIGFIVAGLCMTLFGQFGFKR